MAFEVASIKFGQPGRFVRPNIGLNIDEEPIPPGGRLIADFPLPLYIEFAYKIWPTHEEEVAMLAHVPKWVAT